MRNLYRHLGISENASEDVIIEAISRCEDPSVREDASCVLLNKKYRDAYDKAHNTLTMIAEIGATLSIPNDSLWDDALAEEFKVTEERRSELPTDILAKHREAEEEARKEELALAEAQTKKEKMVSDIASRRLDAERYAYLLIAATAIVIPALYFLATLVT